MYSTKIYLWLKICEVYRSTNRVQILLSNLGRVRNYFKEHRVNITDMWINNWCFIKNLGANLGTKRLKLHLIFTCCNQQNGAIITRFKYNWFI